MGSRRWQVAVVPLLLLPPACGSQTADSAGEPPNAASASQRPAPVLMPDLVGVPSADAGRLLGELEASARLRLSSNWERTLVDDCAVRPGTVARQEPAAGTALERRQVVHLRVAELDLAAFRGPCEPADGDLGPLGGTDAALARQFYRFAADPAQGAPFVTGEVWIGIEGGQTAAHLAPEALADPAAWQLGTGYAERSGPFSALDIVAGSGGYYELRRGVVPTCPSGADQAPPELDALRAISLTAPMDMVGACSQWWGVTLFLDTEDRIRGVALRLGSP